MELKKAVAIAGVATLGYLGYGLITAPNPKISRAEGVCSCGADCVCECGCAESGVCNCGSSCPCDCGCGVKAAESLKKDSCCCGATKSKPCACMIQGVIDCNATCPCSLEKKTDSFGAEDEYEEYCQNCGIGSDDWPHGMEEITIYNKWGDEGDYAFCGEGCEGQWMRENSMTYDKPEDEDMDAESFGADNWKCNGCDYEWDAWEEGTEDGSCPKCGGFSGTPLDAESFGAEVCSCTAEYCDYTGRCLDCEGDTYHSIIEVCHDCGEYNAESFAADTIRSVPLDKYEEVYGMSYEDLLESYSNLSVDDYKRCLKLGHHFKCSHGWNPVTGAEAESFAAGGWETIPDITPHLCVTCDEDMSDELLWNCTCCGMLVATHGDHEGCGEVVLPSVVVCKMCIQEGHEYSDPYEGLGESLHSTCKDLRKTKAESFSADAVRSSRWECSKCGADFDEEEEAEECCPCQHKNWEWIDVGGDLSYAEVECLDCDARGMHSLNIIEGWDAEEIWVKNAEGDLLGPLSEAEWSYLKYETEDEWAGEAITEMALWDEEDEGADEDAIAHYTTNFNNENYLAEYMADPGTKGGKSRYMDPKQVIDLFKKANGTLVSVTFVKRTNGEIRKMLARTSVKKGVKGVGLKFKPSDKNLMGVYDFGKVREGADPWKCYRFVPVDAVLSMRVRGKTYTA